MGAGTTEEIEEERRLLYVAMTRAKNHLAIIVPQRFYTHKQSTYGDRHVYAARTRFIPDTILPLFELTGWPRAAQESAPTRQSSHVRVDVAARMRGLWR